MKRFAALLIAFSLTAASMAQEPAKQEDRAEDRAAIRAAALDYVESWYEGAPERMERALHPELAKRIVVKDAQGRAALDEMGALRLINAVKSGAGKNTPKEKQIKTVRILDLYGNTAMVFAEMSDWIDYMQLAKSNGQWKIVNVLWEMKPEAGGSNLKPDLDAVKKPGLDYALSQYVADADRMEAALHPALAKRNLRSDDRGRTRFRNMTAMELWQLTKRGVLKDTPKDRQLANVTVLDAYHDTAMLKVEMGDWFDYMQVAKWNGEWKIINVLWEMKPKNQ